MSGCPYANCSAVYCCLTWNWDSFEPPKPDWLVKAEKSLASRLASEDEIEIYLNRIVDLESLHYWQKGGEYLSSAMYIDASSD